MAPLSTRDSLTFLLSSHPYSMILLRSGLLSIGFIHEKSSMLLVRSLHRSAVSSCQARPVHDVRGTQRHLHLPALREEDLFVAVCPSTQEGV